MRPETKIKYKRAYNEAAVYADMEVDDDISNLYLKKI